MGKRRKDGEMIAIFTSLNVCYKKEGNNVSSIPTEDESKVIRLNSKKENLKLGIRKSFLTIKAVNTEIGCLGSLQIYTT